MLRCKVDITFYFVIVGSVTSVRACLWVIRLSEFDGINIICICPTAFSGNHLPPHTDILHRFNPRNILISTWFVQIQGQFGSKDIACIIAHNHRTPRRLTGCLHITFISHCIRCQPWFKNQFFVGCFHLQRCLHACWWKRRLRSIVGNSPFHQSTDFC